MKNLLSTSVLLLLLVSCKEHTTTTTTTTVSTPTETEIVTDAKLEKACYGYDNDGSKITFDVTKTDDAVVGQLTFVLKEKDRNSGEFVGQIAGDKLMGVYTFMSEGVESKRELAFKIDGNQLIEGYGEMNDDGTTFKDVSTISYTSNMPLILNGCN